MAKKNKSSIPVEIIDFDHPHSASDYDNVVDYREKYKIDLGKARLKDKRKQRLKGQTSKIALLLLCCYMVFLIFGVFTTKYYKNDDSVIQPVIANYQILKGRKDYNVLKKQIIQLQDILVDMTIIDIKIANEEIGYDEAALQYTQILNDRIDKMIPKVKALNVQSENELLKQRLESILSNDLAIYLQKMSAALIASDVSAAQEALQWRESAFQSYDSIEDDIKTLAKNLLIDDEEFLNWNLNNAVLNKDSTAVLE